MNWFGILVAVLQLCAAAEGAWSHEWQTAITYAAFSVASAAIAWGG